MMMGKCGLFRQCVTELGLLFLFFQAEDGIRVIGVTGVQTCALPISLAGSSSSPHATTANANTRTIIKTLSLLSIPVTPLCRWPAPAKDGGPRQVRGRRQPTGASGGKASRPNLSDRLLVAARSWHVYASERGGSFENRAPACAPVGARGCFGRHAGRWRDRAGGRAQ